MYPPYFSNRSKNLHESKDKFLIHQNYFITSCSTNKGSNRDNLHGVANFHLHLLFGRSVSMSDDSNDTAELHPEECQNKLTSSVTSYKWTPLPLINTVYPLRLIMKTSQLSVILDKLYREIKKEHNLTLNAIRQRQ